MNTGDPQDDFTEAAYRKILRLAKQRYEFVGFRDSFRPNTVLWRHDLDLSIHRALRLAEIEYEEGVQATYFFLLHSPYYNLLEFDICQMAKKILSLGHKAALHFDFKFYETTMIQKHFSALVEKEKAFLGDLLDAEVEAISYHNPSPTELSDYNKEELCGMRNAYGKELQANYRYCSDSNGYWRFDPLPKVLKDPSISNLQVLTHPEWWTPTPLSPRQRVSRCIDGRAQFQHQRYDAALKSMGRLNVL
jgi:hypothetical protein